jgi:exodeoxyribonuclease-5
MNDTLIQTIPSTIELTDEQKSAVDLAIAFFTDKNNTRQEFKLGGYAGTGKTTVIRALIKALRLDDLRVSVNAFTGKACNVLNKKHVPAATLHSLMYETIEDPTTHAIEFIKRTSLNGLPDVIIVDEASMVNQELYNDLISYGKKVLFVGDPGQLEPVGDNPRLMTTPDFVLSKIHRQSELSPIITLANGIRLGRSLPMYQKAAELTVRSKLVPTDELLAVDQVIVGTNKLRKEYNRTMRSAKGLPDNDLTINDKIIVLRNNRQYAVFNGQILFVKTIKQVNSTDYWLANCEDEVGKTYYDLRLWKVPLHDKFFEPKEDKIPKDRVWFDFGYAITCHKAQGSEWDRVLVVDTWVPPQVWDVKKWRYTAITRAAKSLVYCK